MASYRALEVIDRYRKEAQSAGFLVDRANRLRIPPLRYMKRLRSLRELYR